MELEIFNNFFLENEKIKSKDEFKNDNAKNIIYEVLRVIDGKPLFLKEHIERMKKSFETINEKVPFEFNDLKVNIEKLIEVNNSLDGNIKITFDLDNKNLKIYYIKHSYPSKELYDTGIKVMLYHGERKNPNAKIIDKDFRTKVNIEIKKNNCYEAILVNNDGFITEGSKSNVFFIKGDKLITPFSKDVLKGITRENIINIALNQNITFSEENICYKDINKFDAMFISGTSPKVLPIYEINNIKMDTKNLILLKIIEKYNEVINENISKF